MGKAGSETWRPPPWPCGHGPADRDGQGAPFAAGGHPSRLPAAAGPCPHTPPASCSHRYHPSTTCHPSHPNSHPPALLKHYRGSLSALLRHPCGAAVVDELYARATPTERDARAAEFYSKEYSVFGGPAPASLGAALAGADPARVRAVLQRLAVQLAPVVEKGMLDPVLVHRCGWGRVGGDWGMGEGGMRGARRAPFSSFETSAHR